MHSNGLKKQEMHAVLFDNVVIRTLASIVDSDTTQQTEILRLSGFFFRVVLYFLGKFHFQLNCKFKFLKQNT